MDETVQVITIREAMDELGIDYADDVITRNIERKIKSTDSYLKGAIGEDYPIDDPRAKELALIVFSDLYDNRGLTATVSGNTRKLVEDFSLQLRLELGSGSNE